jgi:hypothetical protein
MALAVMISAPGLGQPAAELPITIQLHSSTALEERGREQLERLLRTYDLERWLFSRLVVIQSRVIPHSHPILTLNTRYVDDDIAQLATFLHEQHHWFLVDRQVASDAAMADLRVLYPTVPGRPPEGARSEESTYLHLLVCYLELQAMVELVGEQTARQQLESWTHYTWVYDTVLSETEKIGEVVRRHGLES